MSLWLPLPCGKKLCDKCSVRQAAKARDDLRRHAASLALPAVYAVLAVESTPDLSSGWDALAAQRTALLPWLNSSSRSWRRYTEVTFTPQGWHWHDNFVIFGTDQQVDNLLEEFPSHWPHWEAQEASRVRSITKVASYASKSIMAPSKGDHGATPGDLARSYLLRGDADAADAWDQLEKFWISRRVRLTSGSRSLQAPRAASSRGRGAVFTAAALAPYTSLSVRQQAKALRCSESTIHNLRRRIATSKQSFDLAA